MRGLLAVTVLLATGLAGCDAMWGMCGPTLMDLASDSVVAASWDEANRTRLRAALAGMGFAAQYEPADHIVFMTKGDVDAWARPQDNGTLVTFEFWYGKEFADWDRLAAWEKDEAERVQPQAEDLHARLAQAMGWPAPTAGQLTGSHAIC